MSIRQQKIARQIQRDLGEVLRTLLPKIVDNALVTLVEVRVTPDLSLAKGYLGVMNATDKQGVVDLINLSSPEIRHQFAQSVGKNMRKVPTFTFYLDDTMDKAERINKLLDNLDIK